MKPIAVIILNWNGASLLREYLPSIVEHTPTDICDIIVADNGSTDDSIRILKEEFPTIKLLEFDKNYGFAEGYNKALKETGYDYTVLLNSDVAVKNDWLTPLYRLLETEPEVAAVQPKIRSYLNPEMFEYAGAAGGFLDRNGYPYCRGRIFSTVEKDNGQYDDNSEVDWATGACLMIRTQLYIEAGGLDPTFFAHMEEIDLCWRLRAMGYKLKVVTGSCVYHLGGGSLPAENPKKTYLNFRNSLLMLYKNLPAGQRKKMLFKRRLLDTLAWGMYVAKFDLANARAIFRAHRDYVKISKTYADSPAPKIPLPERRNIIVDYYIKGRKTYNLL